MVCDKKSISKHERKAAGLGKRQGVELEVEDVKVLYRRIY